MTIKEFNALSVLIRHAQHDLNYGEGGSYNDGESFDTKEAALALQAIKYVQRLMGKKQHQMTARNINRAFASGKLSITI